MSYNQISKEKLLNIKHHDREYFNMFEEGGAIVFRCHNKFEIYEIPLYGGEPRYSGEYDVNDLEKLIEVIESWT